MNLNKKGDVNSRMGNTLVRETRNLLVLMFLKQL